MPKSETISSCAVTVPSEPEPASLVALAQGSALIGLGLFIRSRKRKKSA